MRTLFFAAAVAVVAPATANAGNASSTEPAGGAYQHVSDLVPLPAFIPGLGSLYVDPETLPAGPFAAYDHSGKLVSTIYMIPLSDIEAQTPFEDLTTAGSTVESVSMYYNAGHPGVDVPHYHVVLWHVALADADLE